MPDRRFAWTLILLAVTVRAAAVLGLQSYNVPHSTYEHGEIASNLLAGRGFSVKFLGADGPTSQQAPIYPWLVAGAYALGGIETPRALLILELGQAVLGGFLVLGVLRLSREVAPGFPWVARGAGAIVALHPTLVYAATHVQVAGLAATLLTFVLASAYRTGRVGDFRGAVETGVWLTLLTLTDPILGLSAVGVCWALILNDLAQFREGEPPGEPSVLSAQQELRPPGITQDDLGLSRGARAEHRAGSPPCEGGVRGGNTWQIHSPNVDQHPNWLKNRASSSRTCLSGTPPNPPFSKGGTGPNSTCMIAIIAATFALGLLPWTIRNYGVHGEFVAVKSTFGYAFWQGNCSLSEGTDKVVRASVERALQAPGSTLDPRSLNDALWKARHQAGYLDDIALTRDDYLVLASVSEPERSRILFRRAIADLRAEPWRYPRLCLRRLRYFFLFDETNPKTRNAVYRASHLGLSILAVLGLILAGSKLRLKLLPTIVTVALIAGFHSLTIVSARFHVPIEPLLALWAGCGLARISAATSDDVKGVGIVHRLHGNMARVGV